MSPKSRGRPKGRGRPIRKRHPASSRRPTLHERDIAPVVATVDKLEGDFRDAYDDESAWGPGKQVMSALMERGVDLSDKDAVEAAIRAYNAEQLARRLEESRLGVG